MAYIDCEETTSLVLMPSRSVTQVLAEAQAVDDLKASGHDTGPLCGLAFAVKDNIDVVGYPTVAGTPALHGGRTATTCGFAASPVFHCMHWPAQQYCSCMEHLLL